ncbi:hypothetical protein C4569_00525 [Candidatus Parcubacteria bacterium]|nr:MAG: hypothetical protein C4569_00525 [Candidatus Parcubacteria bacterium]
MNKKSNNFIDYLESIAVLIGTVIGAGILGLPYLVVKAGLTIALINFVLVCSGIIILSLYFAKIVLKSNEDHQLAGYAGIYFGRTGRNLLGFFLIAEIYGALLAYMVGEGQVLSSFFRGSSTTYSILFYVVFSVMIYFGLNLIKRFELLMTFFMFIVVIFITLISSSHFNLTNFAPFDLSNLLLPYGATLFAFSGASAVPQMRKILIGNEKKLFSAILCGYSLIFVIYFLFAVIVAGATGIFTTEIATIGLGKVLGPEALMLANLFAFFTMGTSFLTLGLALKQTFEYDYKFGKNLSWLLTVIVPLAMFLYVKKDFIEILNFFGAVAGGLVGIMIILMFFKSKRTERKAETVSAKSYLIGVILIIMFVSGIVYTLLSG